VTNLLVWPGTTTKPYISSSAYIMKMSDFERGAWCDTWDVLFWRFIHKHREFVRHNMRTRMMAWQLDRMPSERLQRHLVTAEKFLERLW
jgi:deoxyribodipyrimidine photolyase-related protein